MSGKSSWTQEDCFPIIFRTLQELSSNKGGNWITHEELVEALLKHIDMIELVVLAKSHLYRDEEIDERSIVSNMIAWFSQKLTEYEHGKLSESYSQFSLIEEAWESLDRRVTEDGYSYKMRHLRRDTPIFVKERRQRASQLKVDKKEFAKLVDRMKQLGVPGELFREVTTLWDREEEKALDLLIQRGYNIRLDELRAEE